MAEKATTANKKIEKQEATLTDEIAAVLEEIKDEPVKEKKKGEVVTILEDNQITIGDKKYRIVKDHRDAFDADRLGERYSEVLSRYDYIVGDWGYDQLRLRGFFSASNRKAAPEQRIDTLEDYLYEFCNFGCAYFVIERQGSKKEKQQNRRKRPKKLNNPQQAHIDEKQGIVSKGPKNKVKPVIKNRQEADTKKPALGKKQEKKETNGRSFTIRKREE